MIGPIPVCLSCKHFDRKTKVGLVCRAFPQGIPDVIILGGDKHKQPLPNQGDNTVFEPISEKAGLIEEE